MTNHLVLALGGDFISKGFELMGQFVLWALVSCANGWALIIGTMLSSVLLVLPQMPAAPTPTGTWLGWLAWLMPVGGLVAGFAAFVTCWVAFLAVRVILRWTKGL